MMKPQHAMHPAHTIYSIIVNTRCFNDGGMYINMKFVLYEMWLYWHTPNPFSSWTFIKLHLISIIIFYISKDMTLSIREHS